MAIPAGLVGRAIGDGVVLLQGLCLGCLVRLLSGQKTKGMGRRVFTAIEAVWFTVVGCDRALARGEFLAVGVASGELRSIGAEVRVVSDSAA